ncbi:MAG: hypothetical protein ACI4GZ_06545 [Ruminococcus sp.]
MEYIIFIILMAILATVGLVSLVRAIVFRLFKSNEDCTVMLISPVNGHREDVEYILRSCASKVKWMGRVRPERVLCLDRGMDKSTKEICSTVCSEYEYMEIVSEEELREILEL